MNINPVNFTANQPAVEKQGLSKKQKIAAAAGAGLAVATVATTAVAYSKGKTEDIKGLKAIKAGFRIIGAKIQEKASSVKSAVKNLFNKKEAKNAAPDAAEHAAE